MNQHQIAITANASADVMERVLRVTRHRGFMVQQMAMSHHENALQLTMTVSSERPISSLYHQLDKLWDVQDIELTSTQKQQLSA
uniref:acetolactate synthase 2 small subunit n=1 Tax=Thaumasiovibrio occultus TaxID=1891184 RepID=UPI000B34AFE8|nr:acetolactate synthase 2 small subunit [Thaumasiovibrio occultus]